jgi:hypothetical protein
MRFVKTVCVSVGVVAAALATGVAVPAGAQQNQPQKQQQQQQQQQGAAQGSPESRARCEAQARPEIERQRKQAEEQARKSLDAEAVAAIEETRNALRAIADGRSEEALAAIERASGKVNVLVGRNPAAALLPVHFEIEVIDAAPLDTRQIRELAKAAERAVDDRDFPKARVLLQNLTSEIHVRTHHLPLATYPMALQDAARLLEQKKPDEATAVLSAALNTLVVIDRGIPLPIAIAEAAVIEAQGLRDKDKATAEKLLTVARNELERAKLLGYAGNDPEYEALGSAIDDVERQLRGNQDSGSAFAKLKDRVTGFFRRIAGSEKRAEAVAQR